MSRAWRGPCDPPSRWIPLVEVSDLEAEEVTRVAETKNEVMAEPGAVRAVAEAPSPCRATD
jgi:hypothetical protein